MSDDLKNEMKRLMELIYFQERIAEVENKPEGKPDSKCRNLYLEFPLESGCL